jgi:hypothetical protein
MLAALSWRRRSCAGIRAAGRRWPTRRARQNRRRSPNPATCSSPWPGGAGPEWRDRCRPAALRRGSDLHLRRDGSVLAHAKPWGLEVKEPGHRRPVKAPSRLCRSRAARALTGLGWSGSDPPSDHGSDHLSIGVSQKREVRAVPSRTLALNAFQIEAALPHLTRCRCRLFKTMCRQILATKTDRPHLAAFILPSCGRKTAAAHTSRETLR